MSENFNLIWGSNASQTTVWNDSDYQRGWETIGDTPPTAQQFDALQRRNDLKAQELNNTIAPIAEANDANNRKPQTVYNVGDMQYDSQLPTGWYLFCTVGGTSGDGDITFPSPLTEDASVMDGTVVWRLHKISTSVANIDSLEKYLAESTGYGIVSGCAPSISGLTVTVAAGVVHLADGTRKEIAQTNITLDNADQSNPRIDLVYITSDGTVAKITGTAAASPSAPALPSNGISVCNVTIAAGASTGMVNRVQTIAPNLANYDIVNVKDFGAVGDGVTDDTSAIKSALDTGKSVIFDNGRTYFVTAELYPKNNTVINLNGSMITYTPANGIDNCFRILSHDVVIRNGTIKPKNVTFGNNNTAQLMPICTGWYGGNHASDDIYNILIEDVIFLGGFERMNGISVMGNTHDMIIERCQFIGSTVSGYLNSGIMTHWSAENTANPTLTYHPHDITISNCTFKNIEPDGLKSDSCSIFLSATYNVTIENCFSENISRGVIVYPGDYGYHFASDINSTMGIILEGNTFKDIVNQGVEIRGNATNYPDEYVPTSVVINSSNSFITTSEHTQSCIYIHNIDKGVKPIISAHIDGFGKGVSVINATAIIKDAFIENSYMTGIFLSNASNTMISNNHVVNSNRIGYTPSDNNVADGAALNISSTSNNVCITNNILGSIDGEETYIARINSTDVNNIIISGNVVGNATTGYPISISNSSADYMDVIVTDNIYISQRVTSGVTTFSTIGAKKVFVRDATPQTGAWKRGDTFFYANPSVGGYVGRVCVTAGSPGTWKGFGLIES